MSPARHNPLSSALLTARKLALSAVVVGSFTAYALHERSASADAAAANDLSLGSAPPIPNMSGSAQGVALISPISASSAQDAGDMIFSADQSSLPTQSDPLLMGTAELTATAEVTATSTPTPTMTPTPTLTPTPTQIPPSPVPLMTNTPIGPYVDGTYDGPVTDALYGPMQVRVMIQNGQITKMQVLDYPHDRRTSVQINHIALPRLASEIMRAQSAHVDIISGATLSSQAFLESLDVALQSATPGGASGQVS